MRRSLSLAVLCLIPVLAAPGAEPPGKVLVSGLKNPESVVVAPNGKIYVTVIGEFDKDGDGAVMLIENGKAVPFATGLDDPKGIIAYQQWLFVADKNKVLKIDAKGKVDVLAAASAFPSPPVFLNDIEVDIENGALYVSDSGDFKGKGAAIYRIDPKGAKVTLVTDSKKAPALKGPNGVVMDGQSHLLMVDAGSGELLRIKIADGTTTKIADGFGGGDGVAWDKFGRLFVSDWKNGKVWGIPRPGEKPILLAEGFQSAADICYDPIGKRILVPDMKAGTVSAIPSTIPGWEVDETPLPLEPALAFDNLQWDWKFQTDAGKQNPLRPIFLTNAGDGTNRNFVIGQHGVIFVFPNDPKAAKKATVFLDIQDRVRYLDNENEEGLLGLAFHPKYKEIGEFFVFRTDKKAKLTNVVSRFRVSKDDPNKADPASEEELLRITKPFWNHDGGTIAFGPDGMLYITHGDGGSGNDPFGNGQNLKTMLGKVLRIDVDKKDSTKKYGIPKDNPFVGKPDVLPEIWAYGLRNIWRMSFDRKTGKLWAGEVGQNLYEEINIITAGGNYGWNLRESLHPFGAKGVDRRADLIEPIWEYHHDVGKSITGGFVYRGTNFPELAGMYIYGDYVSGRIWALKYDEEKKRVVANRPIKDRSTPIYSFGEDEKGEIYFMTATPTGKGIFQFVKSK